MAFVTSSAHRPTSIFYGPNPTTSSSSPSLPPPTVAVLPRSRSRTPSAPPMAFVLEEIATAPLLRSPLPASRDRLGFPRCSPWQVARNIGGRCRVWEQGGGDAEIEEEERSMALEAEIYDFMQRSANPSDFPTKDQLIAAGRMDLVQEIATHGGWLALGWDLEEEGKVVREQEQAEYSSHSSSVWIEDDRRSVEPLSGRQDDSIFQQLRFRDTTKPSTLECTVLADSDGTSSSSSASFSGRSIEMEGREDAGIEGILSRLEKERNHAFGSGENENGRVSQGNEENHRGLMDTEIISNKGKRIHKSFLSDISMDYDTQDGRHQPQFKAEENCQDQIRSRIQHLESELTSVLSLLRSRTESTDAVATHKDQSSSLKELHKLSDAWEFQENEVMNARDKLRSMRAKLTVLEGKRTLELIEARKTMEEKQRKIDAAQKALHLLRTACIVWPTSASEVLLTGSFDGWTRQRRMERSSTGVFSLCLKLYPGRYEIKFIVDGVWTVDPLRPIVHYNGALMEDDGAVCSTRCCFSGMALPKSTRAPGSTAARNSLPVPFGPKSKKLGFGLNFDHVYIPLATLARGAVDLYVDHS